MQFDVKLIRHGKGRWAAFLGEFLIGTGKGQIKPKVAQILLGYGADPRAPLVIWVDENIIASDLLGFACGRPVTCSDVDVIERDWVVST